MTDDLAAEGDRLHALATEAIRRAVMADPDNPPSDSGIASAVLDAIRPAIAAALRELDELRTSRDWWMTARSEAISLDLADLRVRAETLQTELDALKAQR